MADNGITILLDGIKGESGEEKAALLRIFRGGLGHRAPWG